MGQYLKGKIQLRLDLGTLAANTLVGTPMSGTVIEKTLISSIVASWSLADFTNAIGDGPITVGVAHSDYTDGEIENFIEQSGSWNQGDKVGQEVAKRLVRIVGTFPSSVADSSGIITLQEGKMIKTKLNWLLVTGQTLRVWAYNSGDSALGTTDPDMVVTGHANLWPR